MADNVISTVFKLKRGTAETWKEKNLVLEAGEPGFVLDKGCIKVGDGEKAFADLDYIGTAIPGEGENSSIANDFDARTYSGTYRMDPDGIYSPNGTAAAGNIASGKYSHAEGLANTSSGGSCPHRG